MSRMRIDIWRLLIWAVVGVLGFALAVLMSSCAARSQPVNRRGECPAGYDRVSICVALVCVPEEEE